MPTDEIGLGELVALVRRGWRWMAGLAVLAGAAATVWLVWLQPPVFTATASLVVRPREVNSETALDSAEFYRSLAESDSVLRETSERLVNGGVLPAGWLLQLDVDLSSRVKRVNVGRVHTKGPVLQLTGLARTADRAAALANTWSEVFVERSRSMVPAAVEADAEELLRDELQPTRAQIDELTAEKNRQLDEIAEREENTSTEWDRRISQAKKRTEEEISRHQTETRRLMEEAATGPDAAEVPDPAVAKLLEVVAVRAQLAQTPRILTLEKAASDEALAELITEGKSADQFDNPLVSQEANPLYDQLTVRALTLESEVKQLAGGAIPGISRVLASLQQLQLERAAGRAALVEQQGLELKILRRRRGRALEDVEREKRDLLADFGRRLDQLGELQSQIATRFNSATIARLIAGVEPISLAAPAVPIEIAQPRQAGVKIVVAVLLGAALGLMIVLFRSAGSASQAGPAS